ncbi:MAG: hypothetical protein HOI23_12310 [Deltaproteobacteria bacterium]|nr:hypothetical protein [Deltaproteobacteria bacterium]
MQRTIAFLCLILIVPCSQSACSPDWVERSVQMKFDTESSEFWDMPLPSDLRRQDDGSYGLSNWPDNRSNDYLKMWLTTADRRLQNGWGLSSGVFAPMSGIIATASLPQTAAASLLPDASVFLINVQEGSARRGERIPIDVSFHEEPDAWSPANYIAAIPVFGFLREPNSEYALVVTDKVLAPDGTRVGRSQEFHEAFVDDGGEKIEAHLSALKATLALEDFDLGSVSGAAVFSTLDPNALLLKLANWAESLPTPTLKEAWEVREDYESYQVLVGTYEVPVIQHDERPYSRSGEGRIAWDEDGNPLIRSYQDVKLALTIPKSAQPDGGFPLTIYMHGSGGNWYQAITRGPQEEVEEELRENPEPGTGPAEWLARRGIATVGFDFPLHGTRHNPPDQNGLMLYNILGNIDGTIDNFHVSAMELTILSRLMLATSVDASLSPNLNAGNGANDLIQFNPNRLSAMGQSMGSTIGVAWATVDPRVKGVVFSGSGGMLIEIANTALEPLDLKPTLELLIFDGQPDIHLAHPLLHTFQSLWDKVDPVAKGPYVSLDPHPGFAPKDILMTAGYRDGYFHPRSQAALAISLGTPIAGGFVEPILNERLELAGRSPLALPIQSNFEGYTSGVVSFAAPHTLGHYVVFNQEGSRHQYTCFLESVGRAEGAIILEPADSVDAPCE